ncbi:glycosyltransferase family 1 protein [Haloarcula sp. CBA1131]|uniref:glycosyltransferase family 4 protein n=1 Tax=Haloarcula sp. CBA1131 TaxID=1853686 RepID=UPI0012451036|nr:glycosyltransferase family 4 protein [Haloarcula sp. CBA1131]KAA9407024.1 glycosyltransferase family 1 protein [Haloarcula sp. CBA1131]
MKLAMIIDDWWPETGGGPVHVRELSSALATYHDCTIDIYTRALKKDGKHYTANKELESGKVQLYRLGPCTEYWNGFGRIASMVTPLPNLLSNNYDLIHGHTFLPAVPTRLTGALAGTPTVFTIHGTALTTGVGRDESMLAGVKRLIEKQFVLGFDYDSVISVNNEHVDLLENHHPSVHTIPNGVDYEKFSIDTKRTDDILYLGRLTARKQVSDLIEAFSIVREEHPDANLRIVGEGPKRGDLEDQTTSLGLEESVSFEGRVPDEAVPKHYASAKMFALPSAWEGHPLTLLEAWAASTPVIASEVEGIEEFIDHRENGYLVSPGSPDDLAEAIRYALENPSQTRDWGQSARKLVEQEYSWEGVADRTFNLYQELV